jgi:hypothetical protein
MGRQWRRGSTTGVCHGGGGKAWEGGSGEGRSGGGKIDVETGHDMTAVRIGRWHEGLGSCWEGNGKVCEL